MPTTPALSLPYPDPTGLVSAGHANIRGLAEAVEAALTPSFLLTDPATTSTAVGGWTDLTPGPAVPAVGWTLAGGVATYTGTRPRWFHAHMSTRVTIAGTGDVVQAVARMLYNGAALVGAATEHGFQAAGTPVDQSATLVVSFPLIMQPGGTLRLQALASGGPGTATATTFRIASIGPEVTA